MNLNHESLRSSRHIDDLPRFRGVAPVLLIEQIRHTLPCFPFHDFRGVARFQHLQFISECENWAAKGLLESLMDTVSYFRLCLAAHHTTAATFLPTDVDNAIRFKLWNQVSARTRREMGEIVLESLHWDPSLVSARVLLSPFTKRIISGHNGEWLSTAVAAYCANRTSSPTLALEFLERILIEIRREIEIFQEFLDSRDGIGILKCATVIAHNLGDLDRVMDQWEIDLGDPIRNTYRLGHRTSPLYGQLLWVAGQLNADLMATENHRHYALRGPRALRRFQNLLLPIGPFFDEWGALVAQSSMGAAELGLVVEALFKGWEQIPSSVGYARAVAGIENHLPGGAGRIKALVPSRIARDMRGGAFRAAASIPRHRFQSQWSQMALKRVKQLLQQNPTIQTKN